MKQQLDIIDAEISDLIEEELNREEHELNLIASENYASRAVMEATGSVLTNKYAEGYPGKRYYGGCAVIDAVENVARDRFKVLFGAEHVNVQPHAGSQANMAVYAALIKPGDTIMGMSLAHGGHLTHGHTVNFSGVFYKSVSYGVDPVTEELDYGAIEKLAREYQPKLFIVGASAYSKIIDFEQCAYIAKSCGAYFMVDMAHIAGLVAAHVHPSPIPYADVVTSTTHKTLRGPRGGIIFCKKEFADKIDKAIMPGIQGGPLMHVIAAKAVAAKEAMEDSFKDYQKQIVLNAKYLAHAFLDKGYRIVSGGTDNHLFILDLTNKNVTGLQAEKALEKAGIAISRSCIPNDKQKPYITSGIRLGTPAVTTRGMKEAEMQIIADLIDEVIQNHDKEVTLLDIKSRVLQLCSEYPIYSNEG
jgi:glycine hydroxymethyltransferase